MALGLVLLGFDGLEPVPLARQEQRELIVCPEGCPFTGIQEAIDAAQAGDVIRVHGGVYRENVVIQKAISLERAGDDDDPVRVVPQSPESPVLEIRPPGLLASLEGVTVRGLHLESRQFRPPYQAPAVRIENAGVLFQGNRISGLGDGISAFGLGGTRIVLSENEIQGEMADHGSGILLIGDNPMIVIENRITNKALGILIGGKVNVEARGNVLQENSIGLLVGGFGRSLIEENEITSNIHGVRLSDAVQVELNSNRIAENLRWGIALWQRPCFEVDDQFDGSVLGSKNEIHDNIRGDLCPEDYPWPEGFKQP
jgi:nitrous oxidase accessory protein NosD